MTERSILHFLKIIAIIEGSLYLSFIITVPLKEFYKISKPNFYVGITHGICLIFYIILVFIASKHQKWSVKTQFYAYIASLIPFGTFVADKKIFKLK
jgi:integral membrane protein